MAKWKQNSTKYRFWNKIFFLSWLDMGVSQVLEIKLWKKSIYSMRDQKIYVEISHFDLIWAVVLFFPFFTFNDMLIKVIRRTL